MLAQSFRRSLLEARGTLPPTFLLPFRARISTVSNNTDPALIPNPLVSPAKHGSPSKRASAASTEKTLSPASILSSPSASPPTPDLPLPTSTNPSEATPTLATNIKEMLPLLRSQPPWYITAHIHGRPYLLTAGDTIRLPFHMHEVQPGDILRLNRATHIGSRDYTLRAPAPIKGTRDRPGKTLYLDEKLFVCRATVLGVESEPMRIKEKTKRRQRHIRRVKSKHRYTVLRVMEVDVKETEESEAR